MKKLAKNIRYWLLMILLSLLIVILSIGLFYAAILGVARLIDLRYDRIAEEIIDVKAAEYIEQTYPNNDYIVGDAYYVFKDNCFRVKVKSRSSQDTYFSLSFDYKTYELTSDNYERNVLGGLNTRDRLTEEYAGMVKNCLSSVSGMTYMNIDFCRYSDNNSRGLHFSTDGLDAKTLILDYPYDVASMGNDYGYIEVTVVANEENVNIRGALEILLEMDQTLTEAGIGYYVVDLTIENGVYPDNSVKFYIYEVKKQDLLCSDPLAQLQKKWDEQEAHRQALKEERSKSGG